MPRDNPRRITTRRLLKHTGQQQECSEILSAMKRHALAVKALGIKCPLCQGTGMVSVGQKCICRY